MNAFRNICWGIVMAVGCAAANAQSAADELATVVLALMMPAGSEHSYGDWRQVEAASQIRWQALPPNMLDDALPDGSYFTRRGLVNLDGSPFGVVATGARTMVFNVYFRNVGTTPIGETAFFGALLRKGLVLKPARCPIKDAAGAYSRWWRIEGLNRQSAFFSSQTVCNGTQCEAYAVLLGESLPSMTPEEQRLYTDLCTGNSTGTATPASVAWDEQLALLLASMIPPETAPTTWSAIERARAVEWVPLPLQQMQNPPWSDTENHFYRGGQADLGGRILYLNATGSAGAVLNVHVEDQTTQAKRGDVLKTLQRQGLAVQLARCGVVYQLSTSHWYRVTGATTRPIYLQRNVRCDTPACPRGQENYTLALSGAMPPLNVGEVDAVAGRCPGR